MPHRTSFVHTKGGTGKTTAAVNIAGFLSRKNQNAVLVDGDPEGHATRNLGLEPERLDTGFHDLLEDGLSRPRDAVYPTAYGVDVVPGMQRLHDTYDAAGTDVDSMVGSAVEAVEDRYDHVIIDAPSSYRRVVAGALRASQDYYLVLDSSIFAQQGSQALKSFLRRLPERHEIRINPTGALFHRERGGGPLQRLKSAVLGASENRAERIARALFRDRLVTVPYCDAVVESQAEGRPLSHFDPVPAEARAYEEVAEDIIRYSWR
ncbi:MAG: ParA family protein [Candidatus Nanohaloarchaea archaeon]|nr:ParA family protein [Candidatus Nanohaloarchaea archaeon]